MLTRGSTRTAFCEHCETHTIQRLDHLAKNGSGRVIAQLWHCVDGGHQVNEHPGRVPPGLTDLWDASK